MAPPRPIEYGSAPASPPARSNDARELYPSLCPSRSSGSVPSSCTAPLVSGSPAAVNLARTARASRVLGSGRGVALAAGRAEPQPASSPTASTAATSMRRVVTRGTLPFPARSGPACRARAGYSCGEMTDDRSPWERPAPGQEGGGVDWTYPSPGPRPGTTPPAGHHDQPTTATGYRTGTVTLLATPRTADVISVGPPDPPDPARRNRLILRWFGGGAAAVVIAGLVVLLGMIMTGNATGGLLSRKSGPPDTRSQLAKLCPPPTHDPGGRTEVPPPPPGPRTVDPKAGIAYAAEGEPL